MTGKQPFRGVPWQEGDRLWNDFHGTGKVLRLRARPAAPPEALVEFTAPTLFRQWMVLRHVERLDPNEPDRRPGGLREAALREAVWHAKYGAGTVVELGAAGESPRARIDFGEAGVHWIAIGGGHLRHEPPAQDLEVSLWADASQCIGLTLRCGPRGVDIDFDAERSAFADLLAWLEAITMGAHLCAVEFVALTGYRALEARLIGDRLVRLRVTDGLDEDGMPPVDVLWEARLPTRELVAAIYAALQAFAASESREAAPSDASIDAAAVRSRPAIADLHSERVERWLDAGAPP